MFQRVVSCIVVSAALGWGATAAAQRAADQAERHESASEAARARERAAAEVAAGQRELAREYARTTKQAAAEQAARTRELAQAREQLARTAGEIARLSSHLSEPTVRLLDARGRQSRQVVLGLNMQDTDLGVLVNGVTPNGAAAAAGVTVGDTIVAINDVELARVAGSNGLPRSPSATLLAETTRVASGDDVELRILRDGDYRDLVVTGVGTRSPYVVYAGNPGYHLNIWSGDRLGAWNDIELVSLTPALGEYFGIEEGLLVVRAGRAGDLGLRDGDVIIDIGGREPQSPEHALRILATFEPGESLETSVMRQRRRQNLTFTVPTGRVD